MSSTKLLTVQFKEKERFKVHWYRMGGYRVYRKEKNRKQQTSRKRQAHIHSFYTVI